MIRGMVIGMVIRMIRRVIIIGWFREWLFVRVKLRGSFCVWEMMVAYSIRCEDLALWLHVVVASVACVCVCVWVCVLVYAWVWVWLVFELHLVEEFFQVLFVHLVDLVHVRDLMLHLA